MKPSTRRARNIWGSVCASAMPRNAAPWKYWVATKNRLGSRRPAIRPQNGAVATVASGEMPRIQPVHRSVATVSHVDTRWIWNGRLT
jgi:hypothetical protein